MQKCFTAFFILCVLQIKYIKQLITPLCLIAAHRGWSSTLPVFSHTLTSFLIQGLPLDHQITDWLCWPASKYLESSSLPSPRARVIDSRPCTWSWGLIFNFPLALFWFIILHYSSETLNMIEIIWPFVFLSQKERRVLFLDGGPCFRVLPMCQLFLFRRLFSKKEGEWSPTNVRMTVLHQRHFFPNFCLYESPFYIFFLSFSFIFWNLNFMVLWTNVWATGPSYIAIHLPNMIYDSQGISSWISFPCSNGWIDFSRNCLRRCYLGN